MSTQFVRYTPDIEAADPYFDENLQIVIGKLEEYRDRQARGIHCRIGDH